jgi:hypothetical protein
VASAADLDVQIRRHPEASIVTHIHISRVHTVPAERKWGVILLVAKTVIAVHALYLDAAIAGQVEAASAVPIARQVIAVAQHINLIRLVKRAVHRQARNIPILMMCRITMTRKIFTTTIMMTLMDMMTQKIIGMITMNRSK